MTRIILKENDLPKYFWAKSINTMCYVLNCVLLRPSLEKIPCKLLEKQKPNIRYFKVFSCKCFILNTKDNLGKFNAKSDIEIFLSYSLSSEESF